ncbi:MAG: beta-lactamase family protein [Desulfatibacillum sp.]|nr:beta-lactamase family protein [Desulfatibacillum sp.]
MPAFSKKRLFTLLCLVFLILFTACSDDDGFEGYSLPQALRHMLNEVIVTYQAPGAAMAIRYEDGSVFSYASGLADRKTQTPLTPQHLFRIGSASKTVTASAVLILYQQGLLSLDGAVESILPGLIPVYGNQITVRMLLNHTSGLEDYVACPYEGSFFFYVLIDQPTRSWTPQELVAISLDCGLNAPPGQTFLYSNTNYILLGLIIEAVSGQNYEDFIQTNIFDVLGMQNSVVPVQTGFPGDFAHGYFERDKDGLLYDYSIQSPTAVWAAGSIISTPADLLVWVEALTTGRLLTQDAFDQQFQLVDMGEEGGGVAMYGLGILAAGNDIGHNGSVLGYQTQMFTTRGVHIVVYTNCYYQTKDNVSQVIFEKAKEILEAYGK